MAGGRWESSVSRRSTPGLRAGAKGSVAAWGFLVSPDNDGGASRIGGGSRSESGVAGAEAGRADEPVGGARTGGESSGIAGIRARELPGSGRGESVGLRLRGAAVRGAEAEGLIGGATGVVGLVAGAGESSGGKRGGESWARSGPSIKSKTTTRSRPGIWCRIEPIPVWNRHGGPWRSSPVGNSWARTDRSHRGIGGQRSREPDGAMGWLAWRTAETREESIRAPWDRDRRRFV
jgi:hypothetical protein